MASSDAILLHIAELPTKSIGVLYQVCLLPTPTALAGACFNLPLFLAQNVWTVVAVLRALPPLARQLTMRLAYLDSPADVSQWVATPLKAQAGRRPQPTTTPRRVCSVCLHGGCTAEGFLF